MTERRLIPDIEGLRAVAVAAVVLYHAHFGVPGGYVGVDVFFVVSGFLITRLLQQEHRSTGTVRLSAFYARRARRLLPAAALVLVAGTLATAVVSNNLRAHDTAIDAVAAALFAANVRFAAVGHDYLTSGLPPSVFQHWWSLAVEEQFYLVWPAVFIVLRTRWRLPSTTIVAVVSVWWGWHLTHTSPTWAYFAPWSRAWEFLLGASCAMWWHLRHRLPLQGMAGWLGITGIVWSALRFGSSTPFPGLAALLPTLGTVAVLLSIDARRSPGRLLALRPLQWIGQRSYGIYLWHWPLLVLLRDRVATPSVAVRLAVVIGALTLAALTYRWVEHPIRTNHALLRSSNRSLSLGAATVALATVVAVATMWATRTVDYTNGYVAPTLAPLDTTQATIGTPSTTTHPSSSVDTSPSSSAVPTTTLDPRVELRALEHRLADIVTASAAQSLLPDNVVPRLDQQAHDQPVLYHDGCLVGYGDAAVPICTYGDSASHTVIVLFGDSHVAQWFPAIERAASVKHWRLEVVTKMGCPGMVLPVTFAHNTSFPDCRTWQPRAVARVLSLHPSLVVMGNWRAKYDEEVNGRSVSISDERWSRALAAVIDPLETSGSVVLLPSDAPIARTQIDRCLADHLRDVTHCNVPRASAIDAHDVSVIEGLASSTSATFHDTSPWFCTPDVCPPVIGNVAVYLNDNHIGATYAATLAMVWQRLIESVL